MKSAALLIVLMSNHGQWLEGHEETISMRRAVEADIPASTLVWQLKYDGAVVVSGSADFNAANEPLNVTIKAPRVRVPSTFDFIYQLRPRHAGDDEKRNLDEGVAHVRIFPTELIDDFSEAYRNKHLLVVDSGETLTTILNRAKLRYTRVPDVSKLRLSRADVVIVAPDRIDDPEPDVSPLPGLARAGAQVLILRQTRARSLLGFTLATRPRPDHFEIREQHPLLRGLDVSELLDSRREMALQLPVDEPALEVVYWPRESPGRQPAPIDALLVTQSVGEGRIVFSQLPLEDWKDDPRAQIFLNNALYFLVSRPEPTPPPSRRVATRPVVPQSLPSVTVPSGARP